MSRRTRILSVVSHGLQIFKFCSPPGTGTVHQPSARQARTWWLRIVPSFRKTTKPDREREREKENKHGFGGTWEMRSRSVFCCKILCARVRWRSKPSVLMWEDWSCYRANLGNHDNTRIGTKNVLQVLSVVIGSFSCLAP